MSVCKQGEECRQGSGVEITGCRDPRSGEQEKKSAQIRKHNGDGSEARGEAAVPMQMVWENSAPPYINSPD